MLGKRPGREMTPKGDTSCLPKDVFVRTQRPTCVSGVEYQRFATADRGIGRHALGETVLASFASGQERSFCGARVDLSWAADPGVGIHGAFSPVGNPAWHPANCKHDREHAEGDSNGSEDDTAVEIDIGVQLSFDEIRIAQGDFL